MQPHQKMRGGAALRLTHPTIHINELCSDYPVQRPAASGQLIDAAADGRVFDQRRGMMRLSSGRRSPTSRSSPSAFLRERLDAVDVGRRIAARERRPEEVVQRWPRRTRCRSTTTTSGKPLIASLRRKLRKTARPPDRRCRGMAGPSTTRTPGNTTRGLRKPKPSGSVRFRRNSPASVRIGWSGRGNHHLRALVQSPAAVVERVDRGAGLKVQVAAPIDPLQHVAEELGHVAHVQARVVLAGGDPEILGQRHLPVAQQGVGLRQQFPRPARAS